MKKAYAVFALVMLTLYGAAAWRGWGLSAARRGVVPADVRQSPGGYRSYSFWRGGK
jgi:hypothetical protein